MNQGPRPTWQTKPEPAPRLEEVSALLRLAARVANAASAEFICRGSQPDVAWRAYTGGGVSHIATLVRVVACVSDRGVSSWSSPDLTSDLTWELEAHATAGVRFCAVEVLADVGGETLGALCVHDAGAQMTPINPRQAVALRTLAHRIAGVLALPAHIADATPARQPKVTVAASSLAAWPFNCEGGAFKLDGNPAQLGLSLDPTLNDFLTRMHPADAEACRQMLISDEVDASTEMTVRYRAAGDDEIKLHVACDDRVDGGRHGQIRLDGAQNGAPGSASRRMPQRKFAELRPQDALPYYQPRIALGSEAVVGFEALARWRHPDLGLLSAARVAGAFAQERLAKELTRAMILRIGADLRMWRQRGLSIPRVSINLTLAELAARDGAVLILESLAEAGVDPHGCEIEIPEAALHAETSPAWITIRQLHERGVGVALDDYGAGYASLTHLTKHPISHVKIHQSLVSGLLAGGPQAATTRAIVALAAALGLEVTAQGVERPEQAEHLVGVGCKIAQGYLFGAPMAASRAAELLAGAANNDAGSRRTCEAQTSDV